MGHPAREEVGGAKVPVDAPQAGRQSEHRMTSSSRNGHEIQFAFRFIFKARAYG